MWFIKLEIKKKNTPVAIMNFFQQVYDKDAIKTCGNKIRFDHRMVRTYMETNIGRVSIHHGFPKSIAKEGTTKNEICELEQIPSKYDKKTYLK